MGDREFYALSLVFALVGMHATAAAIRAIDCEDEAAIVRLANEAQVRCYHRLAMSAPLPLDDAWETLGGAYLAVNDALRDAHRRLTLRRAERVAATLTADAQAAARACMEAV